MSFIESLRDRNTKGLKHPVSYGFLPSVWDEKFKELTDRSADDDNIWKFGHFVHKRLSVVRTTLQHLESQTPVTSRNEVVSRIVRRLNQADFEIGLESADGHKDRSHISIDELCSGRQITGVGGGHYTRQEAVESLIDAARHILRSTTKAGAYGVPKPSSPTWEKGQSLHAAMQLARFYDVFEDQWQRVLWTGARFSFNEREGIYHLSELEAPLAVEAAVDLPRRSMKQHRDVEEFKALSLHPSTLVQPIIRRDKRGNLGVTYLGALPEDAKTFALSLGYQRISLIENSSLPVLKEQHGIIEGLTVGKVSDAWMQLGFLAQQEWLSINPEAPRKPSQFASVLPKAALARAIAQAVKISEEQATRVVDYFTFDGANIEHSLWEHPLLRTDQGLLLVWHPVMAAHPMRLLATWAKEAKHVKVVHDKRGRQFERDVVRALRVAAEATPLVEKPIISEPGIPIDDPAIGDIDVLLLTGNTAFVLECRNVMHPATPHEFWSIATELSRKIEQAIRKRNYLREHRDVLAAIIDKYAPGAISEVENVVAVVVSNSYFFEGLNDAEPYFVHLDTLFNLVYTGGSLFGDMGADGKEKTYAINLVRQDRSIPNELIRGIAAPVKTEFYRRCLETIEFPIPAVDQTEPYGVLVSWAYAPPEVGKLRAVLDSCSFAADIVVTE